LLSRLNWPTYPVENWLYAKTSAFSLDTNKPWIGKTDKSNQSFSLTRIRPPFQILLPQILMSGILITKGVKTGLQLKCT